MAEFFPLSEAHLSTNEPCRDVIDLLERLLEEARAGEIIGLSVAYVEGNNLHTSAFASGYASSDVMMLAVHHLHTRITAGWYQMLTEDRESQEEV